MSAWGKTGRVALGKKRSPSVDTERRIKVDGVLAGAVFYPRGEGSFPGFGAVTGISHDYDYTEGLPSLDAAVMWVLRRVDPKLWREERGEVWRVRINRLSPPERARRVAWSPDAWAYLVDTPDGKAVAGFHNLTAATEYAAGVSA